MTDKERKEKANAASRASRLRRQEKLKGAKAGKSTAKRAKVEDVISEGGSSGLEVASDSAGEAVLVRKRGHDRAFTADKAADKFAKDMSAFLEKSAGVKVDTLSERGTVPFWIDTNCVALNWVISNDFFKGLPGTKAIIVSGECLGGGTPVHVRVSKELFDQLNNS